MDSLKGEGSKETTQRTEPWEPAQNALKSVIPESANLYQGGLDFFRNRANQGNPLYEGASGTLGSLLSGDTLDVTKSPAWGSLVGGVQDAVNSQFSQFGRTGSPAHQGVMTSELGKLAGGLWNQERDRQMQGISMAPGVYDFGNAGLDDLWQNLARYSEMARGIGGMGGTTAAPNTSPSGLQQGIGSALSLAALFA